MTQPAKVQEPSMEEILASIRRIIADDEAKPTSDTKPDPAPLSGDQARSDGAKVDPAKVESAKVEAIRGEAAKPQVVSVKPATSTATTSPFRSTAPSSMARPSQVPPAAGSPNGMNAGAHGTSSLSDIRSSLPDGDVFELTDDMALPDAAPKPFQKVEPQDDLEFNDSASRYRSTSYSPSPPQPDLAAQLAPNILSRSTVSAVESAFNSLANTVLSNNARTLEDLVREMLRPMLKTWLDDNLPGVVERMVKAEIERVSRGR